MGWLSYLGNKLSSVQHLGSKLLRGAGTVGQKLTSGASSVLDTLEKVPGAGAMLQKVPFYGTMRGIVSGAGAVSRLATTAGQALEKPVTGVGDVIQRTRDLASAGKEAAGEIRDMRKRKR